MPGLPTISLPKRIHRPAKQIKISDLLIEAAHLDSPAVLKQLATSDLGLSMEAVAERRALHGPNVITEESRHPRLKLMLSACLNPLVILLTVLASLSFATSDIRAGVIMLMMVVLGVVLRFVQESRADNAAAKLKAMITITATVVRDSTSHEIPLAELVPGDVVKLSAGDMIPADVRLFSCKDFFVIQSTLTGESQSAEKFDALQSDDIHSISDFKNVCFLGTSVESGTGTGIVVETGFNTYLGAMAKSIVAGPAPTSFDKGVSRFTWLMIRFLLVMVPLVFLINGLTKHNWTDAFFFSLAVAVGLTPEMLPMIVTVCLSRGAMQMSRKKVIVKRLDSI